MTSHRNDVPEFIVEKLDTYDDDQLGTIVEHILGGSEVPTKELPEDFKTVLAMQDETTAEAIGETADRMLDSGQAAAELTGYEGMAQDIIDHASEEIGEELALAMAGDVTHLELDDGRVQSITGSKQLVVEQLADGYISYVGPRVKREFSSIADDYAVETPVNLSMNPFG